MIEYLQFEFSEFSFIGVLTLGLVLLFLLKFLKRAITRGIKRQQITEYFPIFEVAVWLIFILWSINILLKDSLYYMIAILSLSAIAVFGLGWFAARDLIAGIVLRFSDHFHSGENLYLEKQQGRITHVGLLGISLQKNDGSIIKIPWNKINGQVYSKGSADDASNRLRFSLEVPRGQALDKLMAKIRETILLSVGAAIHKEPQIEIINNPKGESQVQIIAHALSPAYFTHIESNVKNAVKEI